MRSPWSTSQDPTCRFCLYASAFFHSGLPDLARYGLPYSLVFLPCNLGDVGVHGRDDCLENVGHACLRQLRSELKGRATRRSV